MKFIYIILIIALILSCSGTLPRNHAEIKYQIIQEEMAPAEEKPLDYSIIYYHDTIPSPFSALYGFVYSIPKPCSATIDIYYFTGEHIKTLYCLSTQTGINRIVWEPSNFCSGIFFAKLNACDSARIARFILMK